MLLALVGALLVGLSLGLLGSGGSILTVPVLIYLVGRPEKEAIAESLGIVGLIALAGAAVNAVQRKVDWRSVLLFALPGMLGTAVGATLSGFVSGLVQLTVFAVTMLAAAVLMFRGRPEAEGERSPPRLVVLQGLMIGILTGFVGVGGGFILVPALVLLVGLPIHVAIGTSLTIIVLNSASGFVRYLGVLADAGLSVDGHLIGVFGAVGIAGSIVGNRIGAHVPRQQLRQGFAAFLVVMAAYILWRSVPGLL